MEIETHVASEHALAEHIRGERVHFVFIQSALPIVFSPIAAREKPARREARRRCIDAYWLSR